LLEQGRSNPANLLAGSSPYLRMLGTVVCGGLLAKAALAAAEHDDDFHRAKVVSAKFFGEQILPTATALEGAVTAGSADLFALSPAQL
jgi:acyl-CoA dehydrogenase